MAKQRIVNTRFWQDGYVEKMKPEAKLLYLYLITNPRVEICGAYEFSKRTAAYETGLNEQTVDSLVTEWVQDEKVMLEDGWILIINFLKHQTLNPSVLKGVARSMQDLPLSLQKKIQALYSLPPASPQLGTPKPKLKLKPKPKLKPIGSMKEDKKNFTRPTLQEVQEYCIERNNQIDPQRFLDYYSANGWMVGRNKMKDWKAAVRTWESKQNDKPKHRPIKTERLISEEEL